jgi:phospholipase/carboxylesterase
MITNRIKKSVSTFSVKLDFDTDIRFDDKSAPPAHSLFCPLHYEKNYAYPLVVWLHENGSSHRQTPQMMQKISMRNYVGIGPNASQAEQAGGGQWQQTPQSILETENSISRCIGIACEKYHIDRSRIFIAGAGAGGTMAFRVGLNHPDWFAGVLSIGGPMSLVQTPLAGFKQSRKLNCFVSQARDSQQFSVDELCDQLRLMYASGFDVTVRQYPGAEDLTDQVLRDMNVWIMEQVTGQTSASKSLKLPSN